MGEKIQVTPSELSAAASKLGGLIERFNAASGSIMSRASSLNSSWQGSDASEFQNAIGGTWKPELTKMVQILGRFQEHLGKAAQDYSGAQDESRSRVNQLKSL